MSKEFYIRDLVDNVYSALVSVSKFMAKSEDSSHNKKVKVETAEFLERLVRFIADDSTKYKYTAFTPIGGLIFGIHAVSGMVEDYYYEELELAKSLGFSEDDFSEMLSNICQKMGGADEQ